MNGSTLVCRATTSLALLAGLASPAWPQDMTTAVDEFVTTRGVVEAGGRRIAYTAHAGLLPLYENDTGALMARVFVIAYVADRRRGEPVRPLTFIWNGGPGSSSSELHLIGFGPKGVNTPETFPEWNEHPPTKIVDRSETWLTESDLVFVDPVGTGYSRATSMEYRDLLYTTRGDVEAVAEAIRLYRTRFDAFDAPLFIAGESYGTTRAMGVAEALERRRTHLAGVILISGFYQAGQDVPESLRTALRLPLYTAGAYYHRKLPADLQAMSRDEAMAAAEAWARDEYATALEQHDNLAPERRAAILEGIARFTGVAAQYVDAEKLVLEGQAYADHLLDAEGLELGHYDARMTVARRPAGAGWIPTHDPSLAVVLDLMQGTDPLLVRYFRNTLGYKSDLLYRGPFGEAFHPRPLVDVTGGAFSDMAGIYSDWMAVMWNRGALAGSDADASDEPEPEAGPQRATRPARPPLQRAMLMNPRLFVWNVMGVYDSPCAALHEEIRQTPADIRDRVRASCYDAGHMTYTDPVVRVELQRDFAQFVRDALEAQGDAN